MRKIFVFFSALFLCVETLNAAAVRTQNTSTRPDTNTSARQSQSTKNVVTRSTVSRTQNNSVKQTNQKKVSTRSATNSKVVSGRSSTSQKQKNSARSATRQSGRLTRAATTTKTFGDNYNSCRDAYFACMDQFCATQNETYRRCVCSSKLKKIQEKEQKLSQTSNSLKDFQDFNIDAITKKSAEVAAMATATAGEQSIKKDTSDSANTLSNISNVLNTTKQNSLSTQGILDIGGNMKSVWGTTDLIGGSDIANMTGESLYNAVHAQCSEMVVENCNPTNLTMVSSAYGMYIENDCTLLETSIASKTTAANAAIRTTRHNMQDTRYENYNAHNSLSLNDCIAKVRQDLTAQTACGPNYVHCLDVTGKYLNITTGEPIYSNEFFQIANQLILSGDMLNNSTNMLFIDALNKKRSFAKTTLESCTEDADDVWNEFLQQALVEIYQGQQERVQSVKSECLKVVNECYDEQTGKLKDFSNNSDKISLGMTLEVSEDMCKEKLTACSNVYGGGTNGLALLVNTMRDITDKTINQSCKALLNTYVNNICAVPSSDSEHAYPYGCRTFDPGEAIYAMTGRCNSTIINPFISNKITSVTSISETVFQETDKKYSCYEEILEKGKKIYSSCKANYYLCNETEKNHPLQWVPSNGSECRACPVGFVCLGGTSEPTSQYEDLYKSCGTTYIGSLYQSMVRYALQNCIRASETTTTDILPESIIADISMTLQEIRPLLTKELAKECDRQDGTWIDAQWTDNNSDGYHDITKDTLNKMFYAYTGASTLWGYCKQKETSTSETSETTDTTETSETTKTPEIVKTPGANTTNITGTMDQVRF